MHCAFSAMLKFGKNSVPFGIRDTKGSPFGIQDTEGGCCGQTKPKDVAWPGQRL